jgi:hypothetical protein
VFRSANADSIASQVIIDGNRADQLIWIIIGFGSTVFSSIMTRLPITNLFNAYDLQLNPLDEDKIKSQEVVNYCEARFRVALQEMMKRSEQDQQWMSKILYQEMVA